jgi:S-adenosylmethionine/arginine decarboxylase-like enzyme
MEDGKVGIHITVDAWDIGNEKLLYDSEEVDDLFSTLIDASTMTPIGELHCYHFPSKFHHSESDSSATERQSSPPQTPHPSAQAKFQELAKAEVDSSVFPDSEDNSLDLYGSGSPHKGDSELGQESHDERQSQSSLPLEEMGGLTAFQVLGESHLSIHTYPSRRAFSLDLFSCRSFDFELCFDVVRLALMGGRMKVSVVERSF